MSGTGEMQPDPQRASGISQQSITRGLVRGAQAGDESQFGALCTRLAPALYAWARLRIRPAMRARLDPEDLMQEVWIRALRAFPSYDPARGPFRPWLFAVAKHALLDALRKVRPEELAAAGGGGSSSGTGVGGGGVRVSQVPEDVTRVSQRVARSDAMAAFLERLTHLPAEDQSLLVHCGLEGMPVAQAAVQLGISPAAAEKRWQRLRARVAERNPPDGLLD
jgi:RNA polymerase sigma factor (sigma-70 family)